MRRDPLAVALPLVAAIVSGGAGLLGGLSFRDDRRAPPVPQPPARTVVVYRTDCWYPFPEALPVPPLGSAGRGFFVG